MDHAETIALLIALQARMDVVNAQLKGHLERLAALLHRQRDDDHRHGH